MELFKIFGTIAVNNSEANKSLDETGDKAQKTQNRLSRIMLGMRRGLLWTTNAVAAGIAVGATALAGITSKAVSAAGELEQNMGGSEAVFGEYADKIQEKAKSAFKTMGLSTSDYLATANKMGSLFKGAGFDTETAMDLSSKAMQRAADVASIMGIDVSSAMESIAGAAKGNFTMMDNLGVAINDTTLQAYAQEKGLGKLETTQQKVNAAMQLFLEKTEDYAGNYSKENETFAGSIGTAKAALENFLSGSASIDDVITSIHGAATTTVNQITELFPKIISGLTQMVDEFIPMIPSLLNSMLPTLIDGAIALLNGLVAALPQVVSVLEAVIPDLVNGLVQIIINLIPAIIQVIVAALQTLLPALIEGVIQLVVSICNNFAQIIQPIIDALPDIIINIVSALMNNLPALIEGIIALVLGIVAAIPQIIKNLVDAAPTIIGLIVTGLLNALPQLIAGFFQLIQGVLLALGEIFGPLVKGIVNVFKSIWDSITKIFSKLGEWFGKQFEQGKENATKAWSTVVNFFKNVWDGITKVFSKVGSWFKNQFEQGKKNAQQAWSTVKNFFSNIWNGIKNVFSNVGGWFRDKFNSAKQGVQNAWSGVKNFFSNIKNGIVNAFSNVKEKLTAPFQKARDTIKGIADKIKGFFKGNISMPKIKLPHFKISPSGWKVGDLLKGVKPKLSIDWYSKAMENGMILDEPTIFGMNKSGTLLGAGEAGSETIVGTNSLLGMINGAVKAETGALAGQMSRIVDLLQMFFPQMLATAGSNVVLDTGVLVGQIAPKMNVKLNDIQGRNARGG